MVANVQITCKKIHLAPTLTSTAMLAAGGPAKKNYATTCSIQIFVLILAGAHSSTLSNTPCGALYIVELLILFKIATGGRRNQGVCIV